MLDGEPGVGKSQGAKWLAQDLGVPLYAWETAEIKNKYVGESEKALARALQTADRLAPCVLWIDEIEKKLAPQYDHGTSTSILGDLLTWLQERRAPVLVAATTNDLAALPEELSRYPRFDEVLRLKGLGKKAAGQMALRVLRTYKVAPAAFSQARSAISRRLGRHFEGQVPTVPHATVAQIVNKAVREVL